MIRLDTELVRQHTRRTARDQLERLDVFTEIDSTNSYLMQQAAPGTGKMHVAVTSNQTAGRGRSGKSWQSPPGSGLCLSAAYTFATPPENLPALTLAIGMAAKTALEDLGAQGVQLKWPNDLVASDGKLGGILTEVQQQSASAVTIVAGIGVNIDIGDALDALSLNGWATRAIDLKSICPALPAHEEVAGAVVSELHGTFVQYEASGFAPFALAWPHHDWLFGREVIAENVDKEVLGIAAGISDDGALLIDTADHGIQRITSGSIVSVGPSESRA